jgi:hypothetical protein
MFGGGGVVGGVGGWGASSQEETRKGTTAKRKEGKATRSHPRHVSIQAKKLENGNQKGGIFSKYLN